MNEDNRVKSAGNIAFLVVALLLSVLFVTVLVPLSWPLRVLWARTCFSLISAFGVDATINGVEIAVPAVSTKIAFSFASSYTGMLLFVETLMGLVLISFFLVRSALLKWSMFLISVPTSIPVAVLPVALSVLIGLTVSPDAGFFAYFEFLWVLTHLMLVLILVVFVLLAKRQRHASYKK